MELITVQNNLPANIEDLSKFVLIGRDKLQAVRAEISALQRLNVAEDVLAQKKDEQIEIASVVMLAEMKCGELLNQIPKDKGGRPEKNPSTRPEEFSEQPKPKLEIAKELGFSRNQVSQFQQLADNPDIVHQTIAEAVENGETPTRAAALANIQQAKKPHVAFNSGNNEWYTPPEFLDSARLVLGTIDLDPASSEVANEAVKATKFYSAEDDGLAHDWSGNIWLNPPYSTGLIEQFVDKLLSSNFNQAIVLVNNATDTTWFSRLAEVANAVIFPKGRVKFHKPDGSQGAPLQGQAILYFGDNIAAFKEHFAKYGRCWL